MRRAAYWSEFRLATIVPGLARELPNYEIIEVLAPVRISIRGKEKTKKGEWRERIAVAEYLPGEVLHREWRAALAWEVEEWTKLSERALEELGVFHKGETFSIQIVEKIKDLPAMIRQRARHVFASKIARTRRQFILPGDAEILAQYSERLSAITQRLLRERGTQIPQEISADLARLALLLERSRTKLKQSALEEIALAQQGRFWEITARTSQAAAYLLQERAKDYKIALATLELAERLLQLMSTIERRFRECYARLGRLGAQLQELLQRNPNQIQQCHSIAQEAQGIWRYLMERPASRIPNFNPYYKRLQEPKFQRLSRVAEHAAQKRFETAYRDIKEAAGKLEAVAMREKPTRAEISQRRSMLL